MRLPLAVLALAVGVTSGCTCKSSVSSVKPSLAVTPRSIDFGPVRVGGSDVRSVRLASGTKAAVTISGAKLSGGNSPGGVEGFSVSKVPVQVDPMGTELVTVTFSPQAVLAYEVVLTVESDDPDQPAQKVLIIGEGAQPKIAVTPDCETSRGCADAVVVDPPSIDFGAEPLSRPTPVDPSKLPSVNVVNAGTVALVVSDVAFAGVDAAAFSFAGNTGFPDGGVTLEPGAGFNLAVRFTPTSVNQASYAAKLVVKSDDPAHPTIDVALAGTLQPNQPPQVCANLWRVVPPPTQDAPREYGAVADWAPLLTPPAGGYDFGKTRDVRPGDLVMLSAQSNLTDVTTCTTDAENGRTGLTYEWKFVSVPAGAEGLALSGAASPQAQFRPAVTGTYALTLKVSDGVATTTVGLSLVVAVKQDLVAQVQWLGAAGVDLDVHLVRPSAVTDPADPFSGVFEPFQSGTNGKTTGDINGYAQAMIAANTGAGYGYDWGGAGASDDPKLNLDDKGTTAELLENVSLNFPENDPKCASSSCTYKLLVHSFNDARLQSSPPACVVDGGVGCRDGEACGCGTGLRCVADSAGRGDAGTVVGAGKCYAPPKPVARVFFRGSPTPAAVIPLDTLSPKDELVIGAPCQMLYVADIVWPQKGTTAADGGLPAPQVIVKGADGTGRVVAPVIGRFGLRQSGGSLQCTSDVTVSGLQWYSRQE